MRASALSLRSISRRHAGHARPALDALALDVAAGEVLAVVGASGAGKSTALRIVAGYERPDAGAVWIDDVDVTRLPPERRGVGMVFQHYALFPHLDVEANVAFGLRARGVSAAERRERARRALAGVGLAGAHGRAVRALSGGEQQRVAVARALVIEPRVLLLDEPLSNLDPTLRATMRDELRAVLRGSHVTSLFVTHDQDDAFAVADRVAVLHEGRVLQVGTPEVLYDAPATREVAAFIGRAALVDAERAGDYVAVRIGGRVQRACARGAAAGDVVAVLRPESLSLADAASPTAWPGTIVARRFAGGHAVCRVALDDGLAVELTVTDRGVQGGERVGVVLRGRVAVVPR